MVKLLVAGTQAGEAIADRLATEESVNAPYVLDGEMISALLGLMRGQKVTGQQADAALSNYCTFPIDRHDVLPLGRVSRSSMQTCPPTMRSMWL
jgi:hypothetical protein